MRTREGGWLDNLEGDQPSRLSGTFLLSTDSPLSWESSQFQANQNGCSLYDYSENNFFQVNTKKNGTELVEILVKGWL